MKYKDAKRMLDRRASYFWENRNGRYALVNSFTRKTLLGVNSRLDAIALHKSLCQEGYQIAKLDEMEG